MKLHLAALSLAIAAPAAAQTSAADAIAIAQAYHDTHNRHDLPATMALYTEDADFQLNMGRPLVKGRRAITELERFDVIAGSVLFPYGWRAVQQGSDWQVHVDGVIETSRIFSALGLPVVVAVPDAPVLTLRGGRIFHIEQPPLRPACSGQIMAGFTGLTVWIRGHSALAPALVADGRLVLQPALLPALIEEIARWRGATGWSPDPAALRTCAEPVVQPRKSSAAER